MSDVTGGNMQYLYKYIIYIFIERNRYYMSRYIRTIAAWALSVILSLYHVWIYRETNSSPLKIGVPKRKRIFQPSIFRCYLSFSKNMYIHLFVLGFRIVKDIKWLSTLPNTKYHLLFVVPCFIFCWPRKLIHIAKDVLKKSCFL